MQRKRRLPLRDLMVGAAAIALVASIATTPARAGGTLRVGMTAADIPLSWGQPDQGFEGFRFMGLMLYDALINWDMSSADMASGLIPGLAESWEVNEADKTKWTFHLRKGVKFHDGSDFDADAVLWNFDRLFDKDSPQYSARMASLVNFRIPSLAYDPDTNAKGWKKIDSHTVEFTTKSPDSFFPYQVCYILMSSPARFAEAGDWNKFAENPSGTGPWQLVELVPRERAEFVPFADHWDETRQPQLDKVITIPLSDPNARTAALLAGQVDWIEAPAPDAIPRLVERGMVISSNLYPHVWSWHLSRVEGSPWNDVRVRKAANLAIDRDGIVALLGGYGIQAKGHVSPADPWYGSPSFELKYDPDAARALLGGGGPRAGQPDQDQDADLGERLRADAAPADERVHAAEPQGGRDRGRVRGHGMAEPARSLAGGREGRAVARSARDQRELHDPGPVQQLHPIPALRPPRAGRRELGLSLRRGDGRAAEERLPRVHSRGAQRLAREGAYPRGGQRPLRVGGP